MPLPSTTGIEGAAAASGIPLSRHGRESGHRFKDEVARGEGKVPTIYAMRQVSPSYFEVMGQPIIEGRALERRDFEKPSAAVVVSQTVARRHWPGESAIGKMLYPGRPRTEDLWFEVVGVAADVRDSNLTDPPMGTIYYSWRAPEADLFVPRDQSVVLRLSGSPRQPSMESIRQVVWSLDESLPLAEVATLDQLVDRARARMAFSSLLLLVAACIALGLGAVGTYSVIAHLVSLRTHEIGVRVALGAQRPRVLAMVLGEGLALAAVGSIVGLLSAGGLSRFLGALLYEVDPRDASIYTIVTLGLILVAMAACLAPARRAATIDPVITLRHN